MDNELKEAVSMATSMLVISLVIVAAVIFSNLSYKAYNFKVKTDAVNYRIQTQSKLYNYFVSPNSEISGSDIIDFITVYDKAYKYVIRTGDKAYWLSPSGLTKLPVNLNIGDVSEATKLANTVTAKDVMWTQAYMTEEILGEKIYGLYDGSIINSKGVVVEDVAEIDGDVWLSFKLIP